MVTVNAYAAFKQGEELKPYQYQLNDKISDQEVDVRVEYCGLCHSDISMINNEWQMTQYPIVAGHEVIGKVVNKGSKVKHLSIGDNVGVGWFSGSCQTCQNCMSGDHNLCSGAAQTIVGRHGGFADLVRVKSEWAIKLPKALNPETAGPLFCGGITVFNPIMQFNVKPTDRVGVIGIGGLGHMAVKFLNKWGCEVTAFTANSKKEQEVKDIGAHRVLSSTSHQGYIDDFDKYFDFILNTANVTLNWDAYLQMLKPKGRLHTVGAVLEPLKIPAFSLITAQRSVSGSPLGSPAVIEKMLEFCARHQIEPTVEYFSMKDVNQAIKKLMDKNIRFRAVLKN